MVSSSSSLKRKRHRIISLPTPTSTQDQEPTQEQVKNIKHNKKQNQQQQFTSFPSLLGLLIRRLRHGVIGAIYMCIVLTVLMALSVVLGFGFVNAWTEEPVFVRERVYFDYSEVRPMAMMSFGGMGKKGTVPIGHTFYVRLALLLPDSDYNREIGVFQVAADLISTNGHVIARSSQPCMLKFRSLPIRLIHTFLMGVPLLLGLTSETQKMIIPILKHKEEKGHARTKTIKVSLIPRARTYFIPQIYEAEIILNSKLPWKKEIVHRWKWTFVIWTSIYTYLSLVLVLLCCFRPVVFPSFVEVGRVEDDPERYEKEIDTEERNESEVSEMLMRWREMRRKRKSTIFYEGASDELIESSDASSTSIRREETASSSVELGFGDPESASC